MTVIVETRYGGVYEGGSWAAFDVSSPDEVPAEAFGGDPVACEWWFEPTVPVEVGDSPDEANERLHQLRSFRGTRGLFEAGQRVRTAACTPSDWYSEGAGVVVDVHLVRPGASSLVPLSQWIYVVEFADGVQPKVPERYLRLA